MNDKIVLIKKFLFSFENFSQDLLLFLTAESSHFTDELNMVSTPKENVVSKSETKPRTEFPETWLWTEDRL